MRRAVPPVLAFATLFLWAACEHAPTEPAAPEAAFAIGDAAHMVGFENFYWLPPMVKNPQTTGTFIGTLSPTVIVCEGWVGAPEGCHPEGPARLLKFTMDGPDGTEKVQVDVHGQHYHLNWNTGNYPEITSGEYRIAVWLQGSELGFADIYIDKNAKSFQNDGLAVELIDGRTLPIKFRLENELFDVMLHSNREGSFDVFLMRLNGGAMINITPSPSLDGTANWHPDGSRIVFMSDRANPGQAPDIYTMDPDGSNVQLLATNGWQPEYSPDGSKIAFQRGWPPEPCWADPTCTDDGDPNDPTGRQHDIWVMNADGSNQIQLTDIRPAGTLDLYEDFSPTWHPSEPWITFGRSRNSLEVPPEPCGPPPGVTWEDWFSVDPLHLHYCHFDVVSIDVSDLSDPENLPWIRHTYRANGDHLGPRWSPDGTVLTVKRNADEGFVVAFLQPPTSVTEWPGERRFLTPMIDWQGTEDGNLAWSPDGNTVLFTSERSGDRGIYLVDDWAQWLVQGDAYPQTPILLETNIMNDWARFRPY